ncbi:hypothetical protein BBW65_02690 [Helicobacter enhydrae]|uniref:Replication-associated recombination protein A n=1 Tax=Helicobacter enhydrae TaxID=222136 RepID=A0A1B1U507_9HELI|nr:replication-associated recombination protein A [Helicobacter enhydrae]ANV97775.1 hypothetical protein BBW65_02690 [Helicobacter enhydrae]
MKNLASLLRPSTLQDFVGQQHIINADSALYASLQQGKLPHLIFFGPPGSGKTSLSKILAQSVQSDFHLLNATHFKLEQLRQILSSSSLFTPTILIDEIHRLSKTQQEALLPIMEENQAYIIGCSTLNPYYALTNAIRSRAFLFEFYPLTPKDLKTLLHRAITRYAINITQEATDYLIYSSNGDARAMLNLLDFASNTGEITLQTLKKIRPNALGDGTSEDNTHYNLTSALIKSIRGSDENASLYYLARLINEGESADFIARRLVILASEDIGNANPNALNIATSTMQAVSKIGYPESQIILAQCVIYLASSPKSNTAYTAIKKAMDYIKTHPPLPIPQAITPNNPNYLYPHDFGGWVNQTYLPQEICFVEQTHKGFEQTLNQWLQKIKGLQ